ncbi:RelA/SpoT family protein [Rhodobacter viridis]|uniref:RelA/SpoT family protein n=1 Tax=Rhodobacter viridis TaxID=1054202 RepID=A0A318U738_9RHOB|nr:RelA/SpoT domain-containing protein [Rhodobacter viridis]PYF10386.1 RelA/SpoT family protein [Rhodobacter viridis]
MPFDPKYIPDAVDRYRRERDRYVKLADRIAEICREDICEQNAIRAQVTFRVKTPKSFEGKLKRFSTRLDKNYENVGEIFDGIGDLAGVRIATYRHEDCEEVVAHLQKALAGPNGEIEIDRKDKNTENRENYYRAIHVQVALPTEQQVGIYDNVGDISCEIQVCTMIAHVWNEIEHDIGYKPDLGEPSDDERYYLGQLGRLVRQGDLCVSGLLAAHEKRAETVTTSASSNSSDKAFVDQHDFVVKMRDFAGFALSNFSGASGQLFDLLVDIDLNSPSLIRAALGQVEHETLVRTMSEFNEYLSSKGECRWRVDPETSDLLLIAVLEQRLTQVIAELDGRAGRGRGRPTRLHSLALRFQDWRKEQAGTS